MVIYYYLDHLFIYLDITFTEYGHNVIDLMKYINVWICQFSSHASSAVPGSGHIRLRGNINIASDSASEWQSCRVK